MVSVRGFAGVIGLYCTACLIVNSLGRNYPSETANMTPRNLLLHYITCMGIGTLLVGCALGGKPLAAQPGARDAETTPPVTSGPGETPGHGGIDYENARPMPLPSVPDPVPSATPPAPPSPDGGLGPPASVPGSLGTGEHNPQVLFPPKPLPKSNPANVRHK